MSIFLYQIVPYNSITFMPKIVPIDRMVPEQCVPKLTHHRAKTLHGRVNGGSWCPVAFDAALFCPFLR